MQFIRKLDFYLKGHEYANFNIRLFQKLYRDLDISALFTPVEFFDIAYNEYLFFWHHSHNYQETVAHFAALNLEIAKHYYVLFYLTQLINIEYADKDMGSYIKRPDETVLASCAYLNKHFAEIEQKFKRTVAGRTGVIRDFKADNSVLPEEKIISDKSYMDHDKLKDLILIQLGQLIEKQQQAGLTKEEEDRLLFYLENTEIASHLLNRASTKKMFKRYPKFEIEFMELPVKAFSEWYAKAELLKGFEREDYINDMIHIYTTLIETDKVASPEAELLRLALTSKYKKARADFEKLKAYRLPVTKIAGQTMAALRPVTIGGRPRFKPEAIDDIFGLIKDFFSQEQQPAFRNLLHTGNNIGSRLVFLTNGNRLADAFKQLIEADFITGCTKRELEKWIFENFEYRYQRQNKQFTLHYLNDIISTTKDKCKKAILNVYKEKGTGKYLIKKA